MTRRSFLFAALPVATLSAGCALIPGTDAELIEEAKTRIVQELRDPASAQFRNVRVSHDESSRKIGMVCGEINGKNLFGGYSGFSRFIYGRDSGLAQIEYSRAIVGTDDEQAAALAENRRLFDWTWDASCEL